ncbi:MAG TPA: hypothetical protein VIJ50_08000 [Solirubrobacteraceae bacterium]
MRKIKAILLALAAVSALSAMLSASASATQWLINGASLVGTLAVSIGETLLLEDMGASVKLDVTCSGFFDGTITAPNLDLITEVLNLSKVKEIPLDCAVTPTGNCENNLALVTPVNLPWSTELLLVSGTTTLWLDDLTSATGLPGYEVLCQNPLLGDILDVCTGNTAADVENTASGVLVEFSENTEVTPAGECTLSAGKKEGLVVGDGFMTPDEGTLTVSE